MVMLMVTSFLIGLLRRKRPASRKCSGPSGPSPMIIFLEMTSERLRFRRVFKRGHSNQEGVMPNVSQHREIQRLPEPARREASTFTVAVVMAGIFAFFIAGIASAFIYAKDTNPARTAETSKP